MTRFYGRAPYEELEGNTRMQNCVSEDIMPTVCEILNFIGNIYNKNLQLVPWDKKKIEHFQTVLYHEVEEIKKCLPGEKTCSSNANSHSNSNMKLQDYFSTLENFLEQKEYSPCAWEVVRAHIRTLLQFTDRLTTVITKNE
nr:PREDICTED: interferon alpha-17-like [Latimeria chalumnae]|eukprot:XP_014350929.1 PREDICTED: interferon alpha-17-like [Latimeria chalumnae]